MSFGCCFPLAKHPLRRVLWVMLMVGAGIAAPKGLKEGLRGSDFGGGCSQAYDIPGNVCGSLPGTCFPSCPHQMDAIPLGMLPSGELEQDVFHAMGWMEGTPVPAAPHVPPQTLGAHPMLGHILVLPKLQP